MCVCACSSHPCEPFKDQMEIHKQGCVQWPRVPTIDKQRAVESGIVKFHQTSVCLSKTKLFCGYNKYELKMIWREEIVCWSKRMKKKILQEKYCLFFYQYSTFRKYSDAFNFSQIMLQSYGSAEKKDQKSPNPGLQSLLLYTKEDSRLVLLLLQIVLFFYGILSDGGACDARRTDNKVLSHLMNLINEH